MLKTSLHKTAAVVLALSYCLSIFHFGLVHLQDCQTQKKSAINMSFTTDDRVSDDNSPCLACLSQNKKSIAPLAGIIIFTPPVYGIKFTLDYRSTAAHRPLNHELRAPPCPV